MSCLQHLPAAIAAVALLVGGPAGASAQQASPSAPGSTTNEKLELAAVLASGGPYAEKLSACKRLALIGDADSVAALAPLLADEKLSHAARIGLEAIPDPGAGAALRRGLTQVQGELLVGVINSLGARRDEQALAALGQLLGYADVRVASAAAAALGRIAVPEAAQRLEAALATAAPAVRPALGDAALACAEAFRRRGQADLAAALYERLRQAKLPRGILLAATRGAIFTRGPQGAELLAEELGADDDARFAAAIGTSRELPGQAVTDALVGRLPGLSPDRQALVIAALGDRGDVAARPAVLEAAGSASPRVRVAAIRALSTLGSASAVGLLMEAAAGSDPEVAAAALDTLAAMDDPEVDAAVAELIETAEGTTRRVVVELAGRRGIASAVPALLKAADDSDGPTRRAAIASLGRTIGPEQLPALTERLLAPANDQERAVVEEALRVACRRSADKQACAERLASCLGRASRGERHFLLELLGSVGGSTALEAVSAGALDADEAIRDVATRVLGEWPSAEAAPVLLNVARALPDGKYRIRALRGGIRILRQMDVPLDRRLAMCREALELAGRDAERTLVLEALGRIPSREALALVVPYLKTAPLKAAAAGAAVSIGEKIVAAEPAAVAEAVKQVLPATSDDHLARRARELLMRAEAKPAGAAPAR